LLQLDDRVPILLNSIKRSASFGGRRHQAHGMPECSGLVGIEACATSHHPERVIDELVRQEKRNLTVIANAPNASASMPSRTPADFLEFSVAADDSAADVAAGGCSYADAVNHVHTRAACVADLSDHAVRLMKRRDRHGLRGCCDGQGKDNSNQPDHGFPPSFCT
jgi:hypothetical protein